MHEININFDKIFMRTRWFKEGWILSLWLSSLFFLILLLFYSYCALSLFPLGFWFTGLTACIGFIDFICFSGINFSYCFICFEDCFIGLTSFIGFINLISFIGLIGFIGFNVFLVLLVLIVLLVLLVYWFCWFYYKK